MSKLKKTINNPRLILFDIDGTLVQPLLVQGGESPSKQSFLVAIKKVFGLDITIDWPSFNGKLDRQIFIEALLGNGLPKDKVIARLDDLFDERIKMWQKFLSSDYKKRKISAAADLVITLSKLEKKNIYIGLLTGNLPKVAEIKLKAIDIWSYFSFGLFGDQAENRNALAQSVFKRAKAFFGLDFQPQNIYIIGDTERDILCAKSISAKVIAVATGYHSLDTLKKYQPDLVVKNLADRRVINFILK